MLSGDISNSVDFSPNKQQREVHAMLKGIVTARKALYDETLKTDLPAFNKLLAENGAAGIMVPTVR